VAAGKVAALRGRGCRDVSRQCTPPFRVVSVCGLLTNLLNRRHKCFVTEPSEITTDDAAMVSIDDCSKSAVEAEMLPTNPAAQLKEPVQSHCTREPAYPGVRTLFH